MQMCRLLFCFLNVAVNKSRTKMHHGRKSRVICAVVSLKVQSTVDGFQSEVKLTDSVECSPRAPESDDI